MGRHLAEEVGGVVGVHLLEDVGDPGRVEPLDQPELLVLVELLEQLGQALVVHEARRAGAGARAGGG